LNIETPAIVKYPWTDLALVLGHPQNGEKRRAKIMLRWAVIFLVVALVAALLGFTNLAGGAASIAMILFYVFLAITVILFLLSLFGRRPVV
jgi:uncharacterized membrane protein YtjA (UPF0391 family)